MDSDHRPTGYESVALPLSYTGISALPAIPRNAGGLNLILPPSALRFHRLIKLNGALRRIRTHGQARTVDILLVRQVLSRLSYACICGPTESNGGIKPYCRDSLSIGKMVVARYKHREPRHRKMFSFTYVWGWRRSQIQHHGG